MKNSNSFDESQIGDYLKRALDGDEASAFKFIQDLLADGASVSDIYLGLLVPAQVELGLRWSIGELPIANEHLATEVTSKLMNRLREGIRRKPSHGQRAVVSAAPGERHAIAARIVSDFLYMDGWDVDYLGGDMPGDELADFAGRTKPEIVAISAVLNSNLTQLTDAIEKVRFASPQSKILIGGAAITDEDSAKAIGADGFAQDAIAATLAARRLVGLEEGETFEGLLSRIGENLQSLRHSRSWNQQQLASAAGLDRTYLSGVENGKHNLSLSALHKLACALEIQTSELLQ